MMLRVVVDATARGVSDSKQATQAWLFPAMPGDSPAALSGETSRTPVGRLPCRCASSAETVSRNNTPLKIAATRDLHFFFMLEL
ncbi:MAG: hypothetical protein DKINENOH_04240 [bacterium]|nr:hypothetical protein [bacterium]